MTDLSDRIWWSAAEIAEAALPGLPGARQRINDLARREGWARQAGKARRRQGKGGGLEYHVSLFPARARTALAAARMSAPEPMASADAWEAFEAMTDAARVKAQERLEIVQRIEEIEAAGLARTVAVAQIAALDSVSERSIWSWLALIERVPVTDRIAHLAPRASGRRKPEAGALDARFGERVKSDYLRTAKPAFTACYDRAVKWARAEAVEIAPIHTVRRWYKRSTPHAIEVLHRKGADALRQLYPAQQRDRSGLVAMQAVNADFHKLDLFSWMATPEGLRIVRPQLLAIQDLYSNKVLAWRLSWAPNARTVQLGFGEMVERWGFPEHVLVDNGMEFASKANSGGAPTRYRFKVREDELLGLFVSIGAQVHFATPGHGQAKPVERAFKDFAVERIARRPEFQGAYTGNTIDAKPEDYGSRAVDFELVKAIVTEEVAEYNARRGRRTDIAAGRSFDDVFEASYCRQPIRRATDEQRRFWLLAVDGLRVARTNGALRLYGNRYFSEFLHEHLGERVVVRFDEADLWAGLHVYDIKGRYLGHAACQVPEGFFDKAGADRQAKAVRGFVKATRKAAEAHRTLTAAQLGRSAPTPPLPEATEPERSKVTRLMPKGPRAPKPAPRSAEDQVPASALVVEMAHRRAVPEAGGDERTRFARARALEARIAEGAALSAEDAKFLTAYQGTPEYRAQKDILALEARETGR